MGIRIHKCLGYGDTRASFDDNKFSKLFSEAYNMGATQFFAWCEENKQAILSFYSDNFPWKPWPGDEKEWPITFKLDRKAFQEDKTWNLGDHIAFDNEYGLSRCLCFMSFSFLKTSYRYGDIIDYYEAGCVKNRVKFLTKHCGIFPNIGMVRMRMPKAGARIYGSDADVDAFASMEGGHYNQLIGRWDRKMPPLAQNQEVLDHLLKDYRPVIPLDIAIIFFYFRTAFRDPSKSYNRLRPMIYTYWS